MLWPMGTTAVVCASGPSLTPEDASRVAAARARRPDLKTVAVSDAFRLIPEPDVLYAADGAWWAAHPDAADLDCERWTQGAQTGLSSPAAEQWAALRPKLNVIVSERSDVPSFNPAKISQGSNSGFQAVNLAVLMGATRIILVGFDMSVGPAGERHFFGDHPGKLNVASPFPLFIKAFDRAAPTYAQRGIVILNASRRSALKCFRQIKLEVAL